MQGRGIYNFSRKHSIDKRPVIRCFNIQFFSITVLFQIMFYHNIIFSLFTFPRIDERHQDCRITVDFRAVISVGSHDLPADRAPQSPHVIFPVFFLFCYMRCVLKRVDTASPDNRIKSAQSQNRSDCHKMLFPRTGGLKIHTFLCQHPSNNHRS